MFVTFSSHARLTPEGETFENVLNEIQLAGHVACRQPTAPAKLHASSIRPMRPSAFSLAARSLAQLVRSGAPLRCAENKTPLDFGKSESRKITALIGFHDLRGGHSVVDGKARREIPRSASSHLSSAWRTLKNVLFASRRNALSTGLFLSCLFTQTPLPRVCYPECFAALTLFLLRMVYTENHRGTLGRSGRRFISLAANVGERAEGGTPDRGTSAR